MDPISPSAWIWMEQSAESAEARDCSLAVADFLSEILGPHCFHQILCPRASPPLVITSIPESTCFTSEL